MKYLRVSGVKCCLYLSKPQLRLGRPKRWKPQCQGIHHNSILRHAVASRVESRLNLGQMHPKFHYENLDGVSNKIKQENTKIEITLIN